MKIQKKLQDFIKILKLKEEEHFNKLLCPKCLSNVSRKSNKKTIVRCRAKNCRYESPIYKSLLLYNRKIDIVTIYSIIFYWVNNMDINIISAIIGISENTTREIIVTLSCIYKSKFESDYLKLGGIGKIVECDESKFGKRKNNKGKVVDGVWVFGIVERSSKRKIYLSTIKNKKSPELLQIIYKKVFFGTSVYTDCFQSYNSIEKSVYDHENVNHSENFVDPITGVHTQTIEANWSAIKRKTPKEARCEGKIEIYLLKFMIIRNLGEEIMNIILDDTFY
ncbi:hypothetical protein EQH57_0469 [Dictyocoela roeselum]|nr:hypothetical protein EQH57_0469 [Dictyocoela roeselum]